jgi:hypothetical protein
VAGDHADHAGCVRPAPRREADGRPPRTAGGSHPQWRVIGSPGYIGPVCTLILGLDVVAPDSLILAANRDEDPARPSDPPAVLGESPRVAGGRDRAAGGTWLAVRGRRAVIAMLNRRGVYPAGEPPPRSRGLLALDVAAVEDGPAAAPSSSGAERDEGLRAGALSRALGALSRARYAPFSLVCATPGAGWILAHDGRNPPRALPVPAGWHMLTHTDLDDPGEPRAAWLLGELSGWRPASVAAAAERLAALLATHGTAAEAPRDARPAVCIHQGRAVTVSSAMVWLARDEARYRHLEGRPCERPWTDYSHLLAGAPPAEETP